MTTLTLKIDGMTCNHCVTSVKEGLSSLKGVSSVEVDLEKGEAIVSGSDIDTALLISTLDDLGFDGEVI